MDGQTKLGYAYNKLHTSVLFQTNLSVAIHVTSIHTQSYTDITHNSMLLAEQPYKMNFV
jgi:hypothetical protein